MEALNVGISMKKLTGVNHSTLVDVKETKITTRQKRLANMPAKLQEEERVS